LFVRSLSLFVVVRSFIHSVIPSLAFVVGVGLSGGGGGGGGGVVRKVIKFDDGILCVRRQLSEDEPDGHASAARVHGFTAKHGCGYYRSGGK